MRHEHVNAEKGEGKKYPSIGRCIYCGANDRKLTDEHIIPEGFIGDAIVFEKASCEPCAQLFNKEFEQYCLRQLFYAHRLAAGAPSKKPRDRPKTIRIKATPLNTMGIPCGDSIMLDAPCEDVPPFLVGLLMPPPGLLEGRPIQKGAIGDQFFQTDDGAWGKVAELAMRSLGSPRVYLNVVHVDVDKFLRFIAKVGHAYAIAEYGYDAFEHAALDIIFGRSDEYSHYIGGGTSRPYGDDNSFNLMAGSKLIDGTTYTYAMVHPYPVHQTPAYLVVVGKSR